MTSGFDAYHKWLGIQPAEQPPDHYRLLGVARFESDREVVSAAADRQMAHVKSFAAGQHAAASQGLLNELAKARMRSKRKLTIAVCGSLLCATLTRLHHPRQPDVLRRRPNP